MALTRSVLVSTPDNRGPDDIGARRYTDKPFMLQIGGYQHILSYAELSKLMADADGEIRDYLGEYEDIDCHPNYDAKTDSIKGDEHV